jgi:hypothetical protein
MPTRRATSFRRTTQALRLLARLAARSGISQAACLELAIRRLGEAGARDLIRAQLSAVVLQKGPTCGRATTTSIRRKNWSPG